MRFGRASGVEEWRRFRTCKQHFKGKRPQWQKTEHGHSACVCGQTHTAVISLTPPVVDHQRTDTHLGIFVHFLWRRSLTRRAHTEDKGPLLPLPEWRVKWCQHLPSVEGGHYGKNKCSLYLTNAALPHWRAIWIISHVIRHRRQLPRCFLPFPAARGFLQQMTVSVIGKTATEKPKQRAVTLCPSLSLCHLSSIIDCS